MQEQTTRQTARELGTAVRPRRWHLRKQLLAAAVTAAAAAGVTAALLTASAGRPPTASAVVTSALARTAAGSYSFTLDATFNYMGHETRSDVVSGAYDPKHRLGTELLTAGTPHGAPARVQVRFTSGYVYTQTPPGSGLGKPWNKAPVLSAGSMPQYDIYWFATDHPVSPAELSVVLRSARMREAGSASGPGWTGTRYAFAARFPAAYESVSGTVDIDNQGRVRRVATATTQGTHGRVTTDRDLTLGNFGAPVPVTLPPASQVGYTSTPYLGYLF